MGTACQVESKQGSRMDTVEEDRQTRECVEALSIGDPKEIKIIHDCDP